MNINGTEFAAGGHACFLYRSDNAKATLVILNEYSGDGSDVAGLLSLRGCREISLLTVSGIDWNREMSPWDCPPAFRGDSPYTGGADAYLAVLLGEILPETYIRLGYRPSRVMIAGYSLAGLFALYSLYRSDVFSGAASISGSLWYPGFADFVANNEMKASPERIYFSLGDAEENSRNTLLRTVRVCTESIVETMRKKGTETLYEINPGGHFSDAAQRCAKGIASLVQITFLTGSFGG